MNANVNKQYKIIALFGESGAGKDTIKKWIIKNIPQTNNIINCTTRPARDYEKNGIDYYFLSNELFAQKVLDFSMIEATCFNNWFYGTSIESLDINRLNIGVFNINAIKCLLQDSRLKVLPIYIRCDNKTRLLRCLNREKNVDCHEICRRFLADEKDFLDIDFEYINYINYGNNKNNKNRLRNIIEDF